MIHFEVILMKGIRSVSRFSLYLFIYGIGSLLLVFKSNKSHLEALHLKFWAIIYDSDAGLLYNFSLSTCWQSSILLIFHHNKKAEY